MKTLKKVEIEPVFLDGYMPIKSDMKDNVLYISEKYELAIHLCLCGCKEQSVTSLKKGEWSVTNISGKVSMTPSILNRFCGTHYIITDNIANII